MKIYLIEDDKKLRQELAKTLTSYGYTCAYDDNFENMVSLAMAAEADLILLDINLPYLDGYHICREIRRKSNVPIIVVTSRNTDMDELMSMNLGADDFVTKPYNIQILLARIAALLKRSQALASGEAKAYNGLTVYAERCAIRYGDQEVDLTKNELRILNLLIRNSGKIVSRDSLMNELWQSDEFVDDNTLTVNVNRLRHKLESIGASDFITTKRGQGYLV